MNKKKVNFLGERIRYVRKGTVNAVLGKSNPHSEKYSLCGSGCKSCTCSYGGDSDSGSDSDGGGDSGGDSSS